MTERLIIAGAGGQGIMLLGKVLAEAAMRENKHVTWLPAYGAEVRGGTAHCMVIISDSEVGSPYVSTADTLIIMNEPSLDKFEPKAASGGLLIVNSSLASPKKNSKARLISQPFTDIAIGLGNMRVANMVALGCYIAAKKIVTKASVFKVMREMAPAGNKELVAINEKALEEGMALK
jgi:2-oxoglutarate ferredoxin oxidoreductase subunit gamma